jgi:hypothetical protein
LPGQFAAVLGPQALDLFAAPWAVSAGEHPADGIGIRVSKIS